MSLDLSLSLYSSQERSESIAGLIKTYALTQKNPRSKALLREPLIVHSYTNLINVYAICVQIKI